MAGRAAEEKSEAGDAAAVHKPSVARVIAFSKTKVVHFIRHGQAGHNLGFLSRGEEAYEDWAYEDSALTELGEEQARGLQAALDGLQIDFVFVSPLWRTLQTMELGVPRARELAVRASELIRETHGVHPVNKRKEVGALREAFAFVDFAGVPEGDDPWWSMEREPQSRVAERALAFLRELLERPERHIAVVSHNDFLTALFRLPELAVPDDHRGTFANCEVRSVVLEPLDS